MSIGSDLDHKRFDQSWSCRLFWIVEPPPRGWLLVTGRGAQIVGREPRERVSQEAFVNQSWRYRVNSNVG
jgi:hypothetical protein